MKSTKLSISYFITAIGALASIVFATLAGICAFLSDTYYPDIGRFRSAIVEFGFAAPIIISGILLVIGLILLAKEYLHAKD